MTAAAPHSRRASGPLSRLRATPLALKLALLGAVLTAAVVGVAFLVLRARAESAVRRVFLAELMSGQRGLKALQHRNQRLLIETSSIVSTSPTLRAAIATWRTEANQGLPVRRELALTIETELRGVFGELDRDLMAVTDDSGRVLASVGRGVPAFRPGESLASLPVLKNALADSASADSGFGIVVRGGRPLQVGCVAIVIGGYPVGTLLLGERLDSIAPELDPAVGSHAVVVAGGRVLTSTLAAAPAGVPWRADGEGPAGGGERLTLDGEDYVAASLPLGFTETGAPAALVLVRSVSASLGPVTRALGTNFLLAGVLAVLLVAAGGAWAARTTLRPLSRFVAFMREGAGAGGFAQYLGGDGEPAEIATLTDAYNRLIDSLGRQHQQLEERTSELTAANDSLQEEVLERERAEAALKESEEALRQSQKLEALGTLAGGVAHDFNNLLSVIIGYAQIAQKALPDDHALRSDIGQINKAADRASGLVRQLLAFSRKQVLQPQLIDLNQVVFGVEKMLRRLISEDVELSTRLAPRLDRITADPGQVEQVLINLVVNARDAMPRGGRLTIETQNVRLDERYERRPGNIGAGPAVMLVVSDTGSGMDAFTRERIFEPFFTTKPPGKGTGLGLSTVYGIVRQSGGSITVYSEPGAGSTFRIYFPPAQPGDEVGSVVAEAAAPAGSETVLVAEDEEQLRALLSRGLTGLGYKVLEAADGQAAIDLSVAYAGKIDALVSDVVMPHVSGSELAKRLSAMRPGIKVLFLSGYSAEAIARHGVVAPGSVFLQKPVAIDTLAQTLRETLDREGARSPA